MFDSIAPVYDRMNTIMTAGLDGRWRRAAVRAARVSRGGSALDVACGTGKLTAALAAAVGPSGRVVGVDLSVAMLEEARRAFGALGQVEFVAGNALALPFERERRSTRPRSPLGCGTWRASRMVSARWRGSSGRAAAWSAWS